MRLAHSQTICMIFLHTLLLCQIFRWGRHSGGAQREGEALTPSTSPAYVPSAMRPPWRHTPSPAGQPGAGSCSWAPAVSPWIPGLRAWHLGVQGSQCEGCCCEMLFSPRSLRAWCLELWLGGQQHSRTIHVLTGAKIPKTHLFSFCGSTNFLCLYNKQLLIRLLAGREGEFRVYPWPV